MWLYDAPFPRIPEPSLPVVSDSPSDLAGPVPVPTGPTEGAAIAEPVVPPVAVPTADAGAPSIVGSPSLAAQPIAVSGTDVVLAVTAPWTVQRFDASIPGCPVIEGSGTVVAAQFADQVIYIGATNGVTIAKR